jgi:hypothetical protein
MTVSSTTVSFNAGTTTTNLAALTASSSTLTLASGVAVGAATVSLTGSTLQGSGTVNGPVTLTGSTIHPGMSPGLLTVSGNFTMDSASAVNAALGGASACSMAAPPPACYSQLVVTGTAMLAGTLNVTYFNGFAAAPGNSFALIEPMMLSGTFTTTNFPAPPTGSMFNLSYAAAPTGVVMSTTQAMFSASPNPLAFGNQPKGMPSSAMTLTFSNPGTAPLMITGGLTPTGGNASDFVQVAGTLPTACSSLTITIAAGSSCTVQYIFTPSTAGNEMTTLMVADNAPGNPQTVTLTGTGTQPMVSLPASEPFGTVPLNTPSTTQTVTLMNTGTGALNFTAISVMGVSPANNTDFAITGGTCAVGTAVPAGTAAGPGTCTVTLVFTPTAQPAAGATTMMESATLSFTDNASPATQTVPLSGTGTLPVVTFTPTVAAGVNFGAVAPGTTTGVFTETIMVTAGTGNLRISTIIIATTTAGAGANDFAFAGAGTTCPTDGGTVNAGTSCVVAMTFTPTLSATENGTLTITGTNLTGSPVVIPLTGLGASTAAGFQFTVQPNPGGGNGAVVTLTPGETAIFPLVITPNTGFIGPITLTCGTLTPPTNTTICSIATPTVNITKSPSQPVVVNLTFQTNCVVTHMAPRGPGSQPSVPAAPMGAVLVLAVLVTMRWRRGNRARGWVPQLATACGIVLLVVLVMTWTACVNDPPPAIPGAPTTPAGTYTLPVTATAPGGVVKTLTLTINVT